MTRGKVIEMGQKYGKEKTNRQSSRKLKKQGKYHDKDMENSKFESMI